MATTKPANWDQMQLVDRIEWLLVQMDQKDSRISTLESSVNALKLKVGLAL